MTNTSLRQESIIEFITHPYAWELYQARHDHAIVTGQPLVERPWWFRNMETQQLYHQLYAAIGWPSELNDQTTGEPGFVCVIGVVRPTDELEGYNPLDANFQLLEEFESKDVPTLLDAAVQMRQRYGFGVCPELLTVFLGDPERFLTTLSLYNERLTSNNGERAAIIVSPPDDFYIPAVFDLYVRSFRSCLGPVAGKTRFYFGHNEILRNKLREFQRDNPCVLAVGGLVHTLLSRCTWCDDADKGISNILDEDQKRYLPVPAGGPL